MPVLRKCATVSGSKTMGYSQKSEKSLQGRVALVTGAGKRLGRAAAQRLAEDRAEDIVHYRSSAMKAQWAVAEIEKLARRGQPIAADLSSDPDIKQTFGE